MPSLIRLAERMRILVAILAAFTMLLAPIAAGASTVAVSASDVHAPMAADGHCRTLPPQPDAHPDPADETCCIFTCVALAIDPCTRIADVALPRVRAAFAAPADRAGESAGIPTPPPKLL